MEHEGRNEVIRQKLLDEIGDIEAFILHRKIDDLLNDRMCQKAIVMSLINIGKLSKSFTEDYLAARPEIPWKAIRQLPQHRRPSVRAIDFEDVYKTVTEDIPALKEALLRPH